MAAFNFYCTTCKKDFKKLLKRALREHPCPLCTSLAPRRPSPPTSTVTETLDNGIMARRVDRIQGATEIYAERARADRDKGRREVHIGPGLLLPPMLIE